MNSHNNLYYQHPKSEKTLARNKYTFIDFPKFTDGASVKIEYKNDIGKPCLYRVIRDGVDTLERVQYYGGRLLQMMSVKKPV